MIDTPAQAMVEWAIAFDAGLDFVETDFEKGVPIVPSPLASYRRFHGNGYGNGKPTYPDYPRPS